MDHLRQMHQAVVMTLETDSKSDFPQEDIEANVSKFSEHATKLEAFILATQATQQPSIHQEIAELEAELKEKDQLIETYTAKLKEWEKVFRQMKEEQKEVLTAILPKEEDEGTV